MNIAQLISSSSGTPDDNLDDFDIFLAGLQDTSNARGHFVAAAEDNVYMGVFLPNDAAFVALAQSLGYLGDDEEGVMAFVLGLSNIGGDVPEGRPDRSLLDEILSYHWFRALTDERRPITFEDLQAAGSVTTLDGAPIGVTGNTLFDGSGRSPLPEILPSNTDVDNGLLRVVDQVLLPEGLSDLSEHLLDTTVLGTNGDDVIIWDKGADIIYGGSGDDIINPTDSNPHDGSMFYDDEIYAGAGDDTIYFSPSGGDTIFGGEGDDVLITPKFDYSIGSEHFDGGLGTDTLSLRHTGGTSDLGQHGSFVQMAFVSLGEGTSRGQGTWIRPNDEDRNFLHWSITLNNVENVVGSRGGDIISGTNSQNKINGSLGDDVIDGAGGRDKLIGGKGSDRLTDGSGIDNLVGGSGADTFVLISDGDTDSIKDFEDGLDLIDVSDWGIENIQDFSISTHRSGKLHLYWEDEVLAVRGLAIEDLGAEDFIFS